MTTRAQALAILIGNETILTGHKSRPLRSLHHYPKPRDSIVKVIRWNEVCVPSATCLEISKRTARRRSGRRCPEIATKPAIDFENVTPMGNIDRHAFSSQRQYTSSVSDDSVIDLTNADGITPTSSQVHDASTVSTSATAHQEQTTTDKPKRKAGRSYGKKNGARATKST
ncbi:hypothetical protein ACHAPV_005427 [Trichoderma viride]